MKSIKQFMPVVGEGRPLLLVADVARAVAAEGLPLCEARAPWRALSADPLLKPEALADNLVSMTRFPAASPWNPAAADSDRWPLQDAKARFSELVRRAQSSGPQHVTLHGRDAVVVIDAAEFRRLKGERSGAELIAVLQASPYRETNLDGPADRHAMPVRDVDL